jgi:8-oxo-dGTP pyrophosphatase MutT (NUDIX family)
MAMLSFLPRPAHRLALRLAHSLRMAWWSVRRAEVSGCNAIVVNRAGDVLLVRHSYQSPEAWMLPGGGTERGETPEQAAVREVAEEAGCRIAEAWCFGEETVPLARARNRIHLVAAQTVDTPVPDGREIVAAAFFPVAALPDSISAAARSRIEKWREAVQNSES